ncbi:MAG TPA: TadE/TadG family type IV pilus assembly protein [Candidatus Polarisedimenticolia bacterium]|nr:TadE/TadG family type IV pilus assembly protein [Candidatus Polarisedimenticolia bacterium]
MRSGNRSRQTRLRRAGRTGSAERGQSLVEFALVLTPLLLILLGIIQFGFIFNSYVTLTNAAREAAREGTIYVYDRTLSKAANDAVRNELMRTTLLSSLNLLSKTAPQITTSTSWSQSGTTFTTGDLTVSYTLPGTVAESDPRTGQEIMVRARYHQDLIIPFISILLPRDSGGRLLLTGEVTMVVN